ncbi:hypothetical protein E2C01_085530 [Portunus trituberculatus]|uniref:Uncharacterized protein n=1 Tax=Portunus trituberculatus TaxID=210409 RepID=A0A5B7J6Z5_PORTR|nr:hypothetical protein [Portunus trituberculatus]
MSQNNCLNQGSRGRVEPMILHQGFRNMSPLLEISLPGMV